MVPPTRARCFSPNGPTLVNKVAFVSKHATEASAAFACGNMRDFYRCKRKLSAGGRKPLEHIVTEDGPLCVTFEEITFACFDHFGKLSNGKITSPVDDVQTFRASGRIDPLFEPDHSLDEFITSIMHKCNKLSAPGRDGIKYCVYSNFPMNYLILFPVSLSEPWLVINRSSGWGRFHRK